MVDGDAFATVPDLEQTGGLAFLERCGVVRVETFADCPVQLIERTELPVAYRADWIGYNVLDGSLRDWATKELMVMADPRHPRHYEEEFKRQIVQS
ncbi:hypothetical protein [Bifidobacterium felsineum]|uniref:hypothetical protein n=1 Tax=Bifidobacterium felsineum TaxID=2045440 RepID=UPI001FB044BC|nr:hypothetical protein [Bifidobacterium felsineum]